VQQAQYRVPLGIFLLAEDGFLWRNQGPAGEQIVQRALFV